MDRAYLPRIRSTVVSALGITILLGTPLLAQADQGKWWKPKEGDRKVERRDRGWQGTRDQADRGDRGGRSGRISYRDRRYSGRGSWGGYSTWSGMPVRRDFLVIRDRRYGSYFRARRLYCTPRFYGGFAYVRPVRFFIGADALIGGIGIHARIVRPHYLYGCNFCDDRFDTYGAYAAHVASCPYRPDGCRVSVSNWDDGYDSQWDGPYQTDDGYYDNDYNNYNNNNDDSHNDTEDDGYYEN